MLTSRARGDFFARPRSAVMEIGARQLSNDSLIYQGKLMPLRSVFGIERPSALSPPKPSNSVHGDLMHFANDAPPARDFWLGPGAQ
jgi:hypothetical protein